MLPGEFQGEVVDLINVFEAVGKVSSGKMTLDELDELERCACPGAGSCAGLFTANSMACLTEAMGMSLPYCATTHAVDSQKMWIARESGERIVAMIEENLIPSQIMTPEAFQNAIIIDLALGGSSNTALHIPAIANELREKGVEVTLDLFDELSREIPHITAISPSGQHTMLDLHQAGGIPAVLKVLESKINQKALTCSGEPLKENIKDASVLDHNVIRPLDQPYHEEGGIAILKGSLAPDGSVVKQGAVDQEMLQHQGPAKVYNSEEECVKAIYQGAVKEGDVVVIRYEGPQGGPGMREMLNPTSAIFGLDIKKVALITDGRFSGGTRGPCIGHVSPEAQASGPIAVVEDGDMIRIDMPRREIELLVSPEEIEQRLEKVVHPQKEVKGWLARYRKLATSANEGAVLR
jgi:dihydroxy-acid dehydratase